MVASGIVHVCMIVGMEVLMDPLTAMATATLMATAIHIAMDTDYGYGYPYYYNGWNNNYWGGDYNTNQKTQRVYGARNGGAVVGSSSGYKEQLRGSEGTRVSGSRDRLNPSSEGAIDGRNSSSTRTRSEGRVNTPTSRDRNLTPSRSNNDRPSRERTTPQRESRPSIEFKSDRSFDTPTRSRSNSSDFTPSRSNSSSGSFNSGSNDSGRSNSSSGSSSRSRG
jgi:hypothetical protein